MLLLGHFNIDERRNLFDLLINNKRLNLDSLILDVI